MTLECKVYLCISICFHGNNRVGVILFKLYHIYKCKGGEENVKQIVRLNLGTRKAFLEKKPNPNLKLMYSELQLLFCKIIDIDVFFNFSLLQYQYVQFC